MKLFGRPARKNAGKIRKPRRYDLPLGKDKGTFFLAFLIGLMTFLAVLSLTASFALSAMTKRWSSGLENAATIEIPAQDEKGNALEKEEQGRIAARAVAFLEQYPGIKTFHVLSESEVAELVKPWLEGDISLEDMPLPVLISVETKKTEEGSYAALTDRLKSLVPQARLDTHEEWLQDLLRFTGALQFAAALLAIVIGITTAAAVAGAVNARMAIHAEDVELLHLMGASDRYISRQLQRHSFLLALRGGVAGGGTAIVTLVLIAWMAGHARVNIMPGFHLSPLHMLILLLIPFMAALIATAAAGRTVYKTLESLP